MLTSGDSGLRDPRAEFMGPLTSGEHRGLLGSTPGFLNLGTVDVLGQTRPLGWRRLSGACEGV